MNNLLHPEMLGRLHDFFNRLCDVENWNAAVDELGQPTGVWTVQLESIPCAVGEVSSVAIEADRVVTVRGLKVELRGYYPQIALPSRVRLDGDEILSIQTISHDQMRTMTTLSVSRGSA